MHRQNASISADRFACGSGLHSLRKTSKISSARIFPSAAQRFAAIGMGAVTLYQVCSNGGTRRQSRKTTTSPVAWCPTHHSLNNTT